MQLAIVLPHCRFAALPRPMYRSHDFCRIRVSDWSRSADSTVAEQIGKRSLLLNDLEEYTNSSERPRIRSATVESAERTEI